VGRQSGTGFPRRSACMWQRWRRGRGRNVATEDIADVQYHASKWREVLHSLSDPASPPSLEKTISHACRRVVHARPHPLGSAVWATDLEISKSLGKYAHHAIFRINFLEHCVILDGAPPSSLGGFPGWRDGGSTRQCQRLESERSERRDEIDAGVVLKRSR
jgi:hypothetical protein